MVKALNLLIVSLVFLLSFPAQAQQRCVVQGEDSNEFKRTLRTDATGQLIVDLATGAAVAIGSPLGVGAAALGVSIAPPNDAFFMVSATTAANTALNPLFFQPTDGTGVNVQGKPIYTVVSKDTSVNALANPIMVQLSDGTNAFLTSTSYPGYWRLQDGSGTTLAYVATATADGLAKSENGLKVEAVIHLDNGASLDPAKAGANKELNVTDVATRPGENPGNDYRASFKKDIAIVEPQEQVTATIGTAPVTCLDSRKVLNVPNFCVTIENTDGADPMVDVDMQHSPDGAAPWVDLGWTTCDTLANGVACVKCFSGAAYTWIRVQCAATDANQTSAKANFAGNKN